MAFVMTNRIAIFQLVLMLTVSAMSVISSGEKAGFSSLREVEIGNHLKRLNKPAVKSIQSSDGDIIDCVPITKQPAFDHPLLRNHTIQMRPSSYPEDVFRGQNVLSYINNQSEIITQPWHTNGTCPKGTVPIRRIRKEDLLRASTIESYGRKNKKSSRQLKSYGLTDFTGNGHEYAIMFAKGKFYGASAWITVWNPRVQTKEEFSLSQIWVLGGHFNSDLNSIEAGWMVNPRLYGDYMTRLFIYWTNDSYQTSGCFNHICPGFVQTNRRIALGAYIRPIATYNGRQSYIGIYIWKDQRTGNWWLRLNNKDDIGYWPSSLFPYLSDSATLIEWGGEILSQHTNGVHTTAQMGSGRFAEEGYKKASYFKRLHTVDAANHFGDPPNLNAYVPYQNCYNLKSGFGRISRNYFYYGGPGRNPKCP